MLRCPCCDSMVARADAASCGACGQPLDAPVAPASTGSVSHPPTVGMTAGSVCPWSEKLGDYLEDRLVDSDNQPLILHVERCATCQQHLERLTSDSVISSGDGDERGAPDPLAGTVPRRLGRFAIFELVDRGGMGMILRGRDPALERELAFKVLRSDIDDARNRARFLVEARVTSQLQHPSIPPVHELGVCDDGRPFFSMKLIEGETFDAFLRGRRGADTKVLGAFLQVCQAVAYAHSTGIVHRDLKPRNIMVGRFGEVQVMDWGLALATSPPAPDGRESSDTPPKPAPADLDRDPRNDRLTSHGDVVGTYDFMPPEQARGERERVGTWSDVFALGGILCQILTGDPPYCGSRHQKRRMAVEGDLADAWRRLDQCGQAAGLRALARSCLALDPAARPTTAEFVAGAVESHLADAERRLREFEERGRRRRLQGALLVTLIALVALVPWLLALRGDVAELTERSLVAMIRSGHATAENGQVAEGLWVLVEALRLSEQQGEDALSADLRHNLGAWLDRIPTLHAILEHPASVVAVACSEDSRWVATACQRQALVWTIPEGTRQLTLEHEAHVTALVFSPNGEFLVTGTANGRLRAWRTSDEAAWVADARHDPPESTDARADLRITRLLFSPDGRELLSASATGTIQRWTFPALERQQPPLRHGPTVTGMAFHPDGRQLWTSGTEPPLAVWSWPDAALMDQYRVSARESDTALRGLGFDISMLPDGDRVLVTRTHLVRAYQVSLHDRNTIGVGFRHTSNVNRARYSSNGRRVVTAGDDSVARLWNRTTGYTIGGHMIHGDRVLDVTFTSDDRYIVTASEDRTARIWLAATEADILLDHAAWTRVFCLEFDGDTALTGTDDDDGAGIQSWSLTRPPGAPGIDKTRNRPVHDIVLSPQGNVMFHSSGPTAIRSARTSGGLSSGVELVDPPFDSDIHRLALTDDGKTLFTLYRDDNTVCAWDAQTLRRRDQGEMKHDQRVDVLRWNHDHRQIVTGCHDGRLRFWDPTTYELLRTINLEEPITAVAFDSGGQWILVGFRSRPPVFLDSKSGRIVGSPLVDAGVIADAALHGSDLVLTSDVMGTARMWRAPSGRPVGQPVRSAGPMIAVECSADGRWMGCVANDSAAHVWEPPRKTAFSPGDLDVILAARLGVEIDDQGHRRLLTPAEWSQRRKRFLEMAE